MILKKAHATAYNQIYIIVIISKKIIFNIYTTYFKFET